MHSVKFEFGQTWQTQMTSFDLSQSPITHIYLEQYRFEPKLLRHETNLRGEE